MKTLRRSDDLLFLILKGIALTILFALGALILFFVFREHDKEALTTVAQRWVYPLGMAALLSALGTLCLGLLMRSRDDMGKPHGVFFYPVVAGVLALAGMCMAYAYLGLWPVGTKTGMIVDMHHQYAPLLSELRDMILHGGSPLYSFEVGLGASFLPLFGYYLASPFNILLVLFPERFLPEAIMLITLLKDALAAALFAACVQYVFRRRDFCVPIVAVMYAMMMYVLAYNWNIMWLDCVMFLPLVVLGFERMMRTGKYLTYVLSLAYTLYANYYIGFMVCLFLVVYYIAYVLRSRRSAARQGRGLIRFVVGSLLGGGLSAFLLLPVFLALGQTSAAGGTLPELSNNFNLFDLLGRHLYATTPTIRSGNLPNIYCGMLAVFLLPIFATLRSISLRRRVVYMGMLALMGMSFVLNQFDLIWHGLHAPNDLPYRFSFLYCFVLLLIAYQALIHIQEITFKQIGLSFIGILAYLMLEERFGDSEAYGFSAIYISLFLVLLYAVITALLARRHLGLRPGYAILLLLVVCEMTLQARTTFATLNSNEYFTAHADYVDNETTEAIRAAVAKTKAIGDEKANGAFYRMELLPRRTCVDTSLFHYRGMTVFASSNYYKSTKFLGSLGYAINGVNSHLYQSFVAPVDSLLGIRYVMLDTNLVGNPYLQQIDSVQVGQTPYYIYENEAALPIAYFVKDTIRDWTSSDWDPLGSQSSLFTAMTGIDQALYRFQQVEADSYNASVYDTCRFSANLSSEDTTATFRVPVKDSGQGYIYVDCGAANDISVAVYEDGVSTSSWSVSHSEPFIIDGGRFDGTQEVQVTIGAESSVSGNIYVVTLDDAVYQEHMAALSAGGMQVTSFTDSSVKGTISAREDGAVFTSIPYDAGWTVKVDGEKVETYGVGERDFQGNNGAMLAFDIGQGEHTVELSFLPRGLLAGILISVLCLGLLILLLVLTRKPRWIREPEMQPLVAAASPVENAAALGGADAEVSENPVQATEAAEVPPPAGEEKPPAKDSQNPEN